MIQNGLFEILATTPSVNKLVAPSPNAASGTGVYFSLAAKGALRPFIVMTIVASAPADKTLDGSTQLIRCRLQFDAYADDQLTARAVIKAVRELLQDFNGPLPDGTILTMIDVNDDWDGPYEVGGKGYIYRSILDLNGFYQESS